MTHPAFRSAYAAALTHIIGMIRTGAMPADVAAYVVGLGAIGGSVSRAIENEAFDGTFAAAVFDILAGD